MSNLLTKLLIAASTSAIFYLEGTLKLDEPSDIPKQNWCATTPAQQLGTLSVKQVIGIAILRTNSKPLFGRQVMYQGFIVLYLVHYRSKSRNNA